MLVPVKCFETPGDVPILGLGALRHAGFSLSGVDQTYEDKLIAPSTFPEGTYTYMYQTKQEGHFLVQSHWTPKPVTRPVSKALMLDAVIFPNLLSSPLEDLS